MYDAQLVLDPNFNLGKNQVKILEFCKILRDYGRFSSVDCELEKLNAWAKSKNYPVPISEKYFDYILAKYLFDTN